MALAIVLAGAATSAGQSLSSPSFQNQSNPDELFAGSAMIPSFERESATETLAASAATFTTRYLSLVTTDADGAGTSGRIEAQNSDYTVSFTVTAPGAYRLTVDTELTGDMNLANDDANGASADVSGVSGSSTAGTVTSGSLDLSDPGAVSGNLGGSIPFSMTGSAVVFGVSDGSPVAHDLRFTWTQLAQTSAGGGDEAAVRLGGASDVATETAGNYPGSPARTQADDGHFVTVTLESLCGNGVIDSGPSYLEDCDEGVANGTPGSCCTSTCEFVAGGTECRTAEGECDVAESCSGAAGACPADGFVPADTPCTADADTCTVDACDGSGTCAHTDTCTDRPVDAVRLIIRRSASGTERLVFISKDPSFLFPPVGGPHDPSTAGAVVELFSPSEPAGASLTMPPGEGKPGWRVSAGTIDRYKFVNTEAPGAPSPVRVAVLKQGKVLKVVARETGLALAGPQTAVGIRVATGQIRNCALFGPATVRRDEENRFLAAGALAAALPDCADSSLGGSPSAAFVD